MKTESDPRLIFALMQVGPKKKMHRNFIDKFINQRGLAQGKNCRNAERNCSVKYKYNTNKI